MRNIIGSISKVDGTPASNVKIKFVLVDANNKPISNFDIGGERVVGKKTVTTDANGDFTVSLWENDKFIDVSYYYVTVSMTGDTPFKSALLTGTGDISWLDFKLSGQPVTPAELEVLQAYFDTVYQPIGTSSLPAIGDMLVTYATAPTGYILVEDTGVDEVLYPELALLLPKKMVSNPLETIETETFIGGLLYVIDDTSIQIYNTQEELLETISIPTQYTSIESTAVVNNILYAYDGTTQTVLSYANGIWTNLQIPALDYYHITPYENYIIAWGANNENMFEWDSTTWVQIVLPPLVDSIQGLQYNNSYLYFIGRSTIYCTQDKVTWVEVPLPADANISTFYTNSNGENIICSQSSYGKLYIQANATSEWVEKWVTLANQSSSLISQVVANGSNYFLIHTDLNSSPVVTYTSDFVSFDTLIGTEQIFSIYESTVLSANSEAFELISLKPKATNIVPNQTYIYAGA